MEENVDHVKLVTKAQLGDKECLNRLAEAARVRLYPYVYRYTLSDELTQLSRRCRPGDILSAEKRPALNTLIFKPKDCEHNVRSLFYFCFLPA